jgi:hypothetical protein
MNNIREIRKGQVHLYGRASGQELIPMLIFKMIEEVKK